MFEFLGPLIGLGTKLGANIPSLRRGGRQRKELRRQQQGLGAGAVSARRAGTAAARGALGVAASQPQSGLGLRTGLRAAESAIGQGTAEAARVGAQEGQAATQALRQNALIRQRNLANIGEDLGAFGSALGAAQVAGRDQGAAAAIPRPVPGVVAPTVPQLAAPDQLTLPRFAVNLPLQNPLTVPPNVPPPQTTPVEPVRDLGAIPMRGGESTSGIPLQGPTVGRPIAPGELSTDQLKEILAERARRRAAEALQGLGAPTGQGVGVGVPAQLQTDINLGRY